MMAAAVLGMIAGLGTWCVARGIRPPLRPLPVALSALSKPKWARPDSNPSPWWTRHFVDIAKQLCPANPALERDLAVLERSAERHAVDKLATALVLAAMPIGCTALALLGGMAVPPVGVAAATVAFGAGGWHLSDAQVRDNATKRRRSFASALSSYLDLVAILLAGGSGVEQALRDASHAGHGWSFTLLQRCVSDAHTQHRSPWETYAATAERLGLKPLGELAAAVTLAGESGARVRESLHAKAESLRAHELAEIETAAAAATEKMGAPVACLVIGLVALIGYPAVATITQL